MISKEVRGKLFIEKANLKYNNRYDYSKVEYVNNSTDVKIVCDIHGVFPQRPNDHLQNSVGCPLCSLEVRARKRSKNIDDFVKQANEVHDNRYNYDLVEYKNSTENIEIVCPIHGKFPQIPYVHLSGAGCRKCGYTKNAQNRSKTKEKFLEEAFLKFGNRFEYLDFDYKKVKVKCKLHNKIFTQNPNMHLTKNSRGGCPMCKMVSVKERHLKTTKEFIKEAKELYGDKYDYSLVEYKGGKKPVDIICKEHGIFSQRPADHTNGHSCRACNYVGGNAYSLSNANRNKKEWLGIETNLYLIKLKTEEYDVLKIGIAGDIKNRHHIIQKTSKSTIYEVLIFPTNLYTATIIEQTTLIKYKELKLKFKEKFSGYTECLDIKLYEEIHNEINNMLENDK